jgi:hypothetical protein
MHGKASHVVGAAIGLIAAGALWYLPMRSAQDLDHIAIFDAPGPFGVLPPSTSGSIVAAAVLAGAALIAGLLAGTWQLSPVAPLLAGLVLTGYGVLWWFDFPDSQRLLTHLPGSLLPGAAELQPSALYQVLGGTLLTSAALPWRWTGRRVPFRVSRDILGVVIGTVGVPALWYLIQIANPVGYDYVVSSAHLPRLPYQWLLPPLALAIVLGLLVAARSVSPAAAVIAGLPLLAVGLSLVLAPGGTSQAITSYILGGQPLSIGQGQSVALGAYLLFGGMLVVSAALPWRWRKPGTVPEADTGPATDLASEAMAG